MVYLGQDAIPALSVRTPDELVSFRRVAGAEVDVVPLELFPRPVSQVAKVVRLGDHAGIQKIRTRRRTLTLAGLDPLDVVPG